ncbi:MAG: M20/M25/M40 family metallo-hydrolase [Rhodobacteraceae bacterium]|nr:M20/M25/M40 family metallo-hydrolase [Paracoccaceae bacterium]
MIKQATRDLMALLPIKAGPGQESPVVDFLRAELAAMGVPTANMVLDTAHEQSEYGGDIGNLIVTIDGNRDASHLMFSTHMDTVPLAVGCKPRLAGPRIINDAIGRALGGDNRCGCAILLTLARRLLAQKGDHAPVTLVFFVQEEVGLIGARGLDLSLLGAPAMCINLDGGAVNELVTAVTGTQRFTIDIAGIATHAGRPGGGVSAAVIMARALAGLDADGWHGVIEKSGKTGSANVGIVKGGQGSNIVMPELFVLAEARSHDPVFRQDIVSSWKQHFAACALEICNAQGQHGSVSFGLGPGYESFALDDDEPVVLRAIATAAACGFTLSPVSNDGGMDANQIVAHGIPTVTVGVGQRLVHTPDEWIDLEDFSKALQLILQLGAPR